MASDDRPKTSSPASSDPYAAPGTSLDAADRHDPRVWPRGITATVIASLLGAVLVVLSELGPFAFNDVHGALAIVALWVLPVLWVLVPTARIVGGWRHVPLATWVRVACALALVIGTLTFLLSIALFVASLVWTHRHAL